MDAANLLPTDAIPVGVTEIATLPVDPADLRRGTLAVVRANALIGELANAVQDLAGVDVASINAANAGRAVARRRALRMTSLERANKKIVAVRVDRAAGRRRPARPAASVRP